MKAPVSVCIICDDDPHLGQTVASLEPHVAEIVTVSPKDVPAAYRDGRIWDFAAARNASFAKATQPWVMWVDSDDLVADAERLEELTRAPEGTCYLLPYEYAYDQVGRCVVRQYRERLFRPRGAMHWLYPVHEVMVPVGQPMHIVQSELVTIKHRRQYNPKPQEPQRNLRILRAWMADHPDDVRNQFYLGLELDNAGQHDEAVAWLTRYVNASGWVDEKAHALLRLVQIHERRRQYQKALDWAFECLKTCDWFESHFAVMRQFYHLKNWERCVHYGQLALNAPPTRTVLFTNEADRHELHVYLNVALNQLGRTQEAYESCKAGLVGNPAHPHLKHNRVQYERALQTSGTASQPPLPTPAHPAPAPEPEEAGTYDPKRLDVVFVTASWERWDPESIKATGIGGSETMLANMARHLAKLGHRVRVYADPTKEGAYDGAEWFNKERFHDVACDVLVVSRNAPYLGASGVRARVRLLWCHDVVASGATPELLARADRVLALSQWHKGTLVAAHGLHPDQVLVTRNGIELERFAASPPRNPYKIVNSSSPDRSWPVLLECFQRIREREPRAELHLFYGFENWEKTADEGGRSTIALLKEQVKAPGVHYHGRVSQERLAHEFLTAGVWAYPTWFTETSCITAMEAQAAGCHIVTSNRAALAETVKYGKKLDGEWTSPEYQRAFEDAVVRDMRQPYAMKVGQEFALAPLAKEWEAMFVDLLERKKTHPLAPYQPTPPYRAKPAPTSVKLNIACGPNIFPHEGWVNYDKDPQANYWRFLREGERAEMPEQQRKVCRFVQAHYKDKDPVIKHDMMVRFPHEDASVDYIYVGQAIEHLNRRTQAVPFIQECRRMLKPGGVLRMTTPDLEKLVRAYHEGSLAEFAKDQPEWFQRADPADQLAYLMYGAAGPTCIQEHYEGHMHLYTRTTMVALLKEAGFSAIAFNTPPPRDVTDEGMSHSFSVEAIK